MQARQHERLLGKSISMGISWLRPCTNCCRLHEQTVPAQVLTNKAVIRSSSLVNLQLQALLESCVHINALHLCMCSEQACWAVYLTSYLWPKHDKAAHSRYRGECAQAKADALSTHALFLELFWTVLQQRLDEDFIVWTYMECSGGGCSGCV